MYLHDRWLISTLLCIGLLSCQKEAMVTSAASPANTLTTSNLIVGPAPALIWWSIGPAIPYTDQIPNDVPKENDFGVGFAINGKGYVCGSLLTTGFNTGEQIKDLWQFDPATQAWTKKTSFPGEAPIQASCFVIGDNAYLVVGSATYQYNQPTDTWTQKVSIPVDPRYSATAFAIGGKGYLGLGSKNYPENELNDWWQYDPLADTWTKKNNFPGSKREGAEGFVVGGKGYVVAGIHFANGQENWLKEVWQYNPTADSWIRKGDFPGGAHHSAIAANGTISGVDLGFIAGVGNLSNECWQYNAATDAWGKLPNILGGGRGEAASFVINHSLFIANKSVVALNWSK